MALLEVDVHIIEQGKEGVRHVSKLAAASVDNRIDRDEFHQRFARLLMDFDILGPEAGMECIQEGFERFENDVHRVA